VDFVEKSIMAIFPFSNAYVINKDVLVGSSFKAGMVLMQDNNGQVKPADSQLLFNKNISEKQLSIIGIAAGDSNVTGNTIIVPDYIGSNYLDANSNFISISDREYFSVKRQLLDYADETVNEYYNINYSPKPKRRGIGVYSLSGDTFATDQFSPVLHGDYGLDSTVIQSLNPGDLLTFGGGINAGKLVKVNVNSVGPDVLVVGIVDRYNSSTGLLYFRQTNYSLSFSNAYILYLDPEHVSAYTNSTTLRNFANSTQNMPLFNGAAIYSNYIYFDGTNDYGYQSSFSYSAGQYTYLVWLMTDGNQDTFDQVLGSVPDRPNMLTMMFGNPNILGYTVQGGYDFSTRTVVDQAWTLAAISFGPSSTIISANLDFQVKASVGIPSLSNMYLALDPLGRFYKGRIGLTSIVNRALTQTDVTNYYNATKGRYGL
jgi:hypothetical protein